MTGPRIVISPFQSSIAVWRSVYLQQTVLELSAEAIEAISCAAQVVSRIVQSGEIAYGITTGVGQLAGTRIDTADLKTLQRNLVFANTVGVGDPLPAGIVRLIIALKMASFAAGASGVRPAVAQFLVEMLRSLSKCSVAIFCHVFRAKAQLVRQEILRRSRI
jgi:histidine ammonia-lyase